LQSRYDAHRVSGNQRSAAQPSMIDIRGYSHPLPLKMFAAIAKAIHKI
jgi:hypothetical protein